MKIQPAFVEVKEIAAAGHYNVLPVSLEILSDFTTPIETMKILKNVSTHCYMLESAQANETWGRYTSRSRRIARPAISAKFLPVTKAPVSIIFLPLQAVLSDTSPMITSPTASRPSNVMWKTLRHLRMLI